MSLSPHQIFGRLHELKKWQETHEKLLQRSGNDEDFQETSVHNHSSHHNSINVHTKYLERNEQLPLDSYENPEEEFINVPLDKDFEELLEEKLNEFNEYNVPTNNSSVPKKPFLKKGTGLMKYNLKPEEYKKLIGNKYSNTIIPPKSRPKSVESKKKTVQFQTERPRTAGNVSNINLNSRRTQNTLKPTRTINNSSQRPRTSSSIFSRNSTQNRDKSSKTTVENTNRSQRASNHSKINRNGDFSEKYPELVENSVKFHPEEPKFCNKKHNAIDPQGLKLSNKETRNEKLEVQKKCSQKSPDLTDYVTNKPDEHTPLSIPKIQIKPRGNWCDITTNNFQNEVWKNANDILQQNDKILLNDRYTSQCAQVLVQSHWRNGFVQQVKEIESTMPDVEMVRNPQERRDPPARKSLSYTPNENSLHERALETELRIFEALERRTEQSGFCSTNTSIIQLLASTPSKFNFENNEIDGEHVLNKITNKGDRVDKLPVQNSENFHVETSSDLNNQLMPKYENFNWHPEHNTHIDAVQLEESEENFETEEEIEEIFEDGTPKKDTYTDKNMDNHLRHTNGSLTNSNNILMPSSNYSSTSSDISEDYSVNKSRAYRSSKSIKRNHKNLDSSESCASCGFLIKNKIEECQSELDSLKVEKDKILAIREQMDKDKREFEKEMKLRRMQFEEQKLRYQLEIEEEKKKMVEKPASDKPIKDIKTKAQHRRDKEELNNLRMELSETKELMKLRDTKNAMCIARLRNQVKMLEKNNSELKAENEKLIKEKSKLIAQQKNSSKTTEKKMLKEISKNISKLTEETFKNQVFKLDTSSEDNLKKIDRGNSQINTRKPLSNSQGILKNMMKPQDEGPIENYDEKQISQNIAENNIEEKYKSLFCGNEVIIEENRKNTSFGNSTRSVGLEKTEKILEDGTKEIKYSNGNVKRISENGTVRYYYASNDTWHTNFPDGTEVIEFSNGQSEKRFKDGKCIIFFPDGLIQTIFTNGTEEVKYPDGSKLLTKKDGDRMLFLANGQVEIHTKDQKRREYPDGTVKILYPDGSQETRYSNGRIRMKNSEGDIILDTGETIE
ncbi:protein MLP1 [Harmonia axyridis]|uniref:protein MLP1 n=1 Tax=Harmonia axyridis TaxID=115357 RepID=UPI001E276A8A|nr:protein MLP1 [Harmonia axyridis]